MDNKRRPVYGITTHDRHGVRGNAYSQHNLSDVKVKVKKYQPNPVDIQKQQRARQPAPVRKKEKDCVLKEKKDVAVSTDLYLEELSTRVEFTSVECQTDAFQDRPDSPLFIPAKSGKDVATQIEEGELFDFDLEVQPVVDVLVGKIMEQAVLEVLEQEELANLRAQRTALQELRDAELFEIQRLEEQERLHNEEKERRIKEQREVLEKEKETAEKIAATTFAQHYLADLLSSVFSTLTEQGYFYDPVQREIETEFMPWLMEEVNTALDQREVARRILDMMILEVAEKHVKAYDAQ